MLDSNLLRNDISQVVSKLKYRGHQFDADKYAVLESERKRLQVEAEELQAARNAKSKQIGKLKASGEDTSAIMAEVASFADKLQQSQQGLEVVRTQLQDILENTPNIPNESVPQGGSEEHNVEIERWGQPPQFDFAVKDHVDLGEESGGLDFATASKITGSRFVVMRGQFARLNRALIQFMLDTHTTKHGYEEVYTPYLVNQASLKGTGQFSKFADHDVFATQSEDDLYLIPTAEVPVTNIFRDEIVQSKELPIKLVAHTPCFRREAGSYGRDTRGMIRQHQFEKVELVQIVRPEDSYDALEELTMHAQTILQELELPYRKVILCTGDLGFSSAKTYDLEVWLPAQNAYREISSCSNFEAFQARRMKARFRNESNKTELVHTLNGSGLAVGRTMLAIMENYQNKDGSITIPEVLRAYMGGAAIIKS